LGSTAAVLRRATTAAFSAASRKSMAVGSTVTWLAAALWSRVAIHWVVTNTAPRETANTIGKARTNASLRRRLQPETWKNVVRDIDIPKVSRLMIRALRLG
jgi:hypothetical protein